MTQHAGILVVDHDPSLRASLINYLAGHGLQADGAATAAAANTAVTTAHYNIVLLDLNLPDGDGIDLVQRWRAHIKISIICLSNRTEEADMVMGLELGADDYIIKPFSLREVLARMRAVMRRSQSKAVPMTRGTQPRVYRFSGWSLNLNTRRLHSAAQRIVALTNAEFNLLTVFLSHPHNVISREKLLESTRAFDDIYDRAIDVQILRLRRKLELDPKHPALLRTERGIGYFFDTEVETVWE